MEEIFALVAELLATLGAMYSIYAAMTWCRLATGIAIAKMVPFEKAVTCIAANPINLGHLAVTTRAGSEQRTTGLRIAGS
jgi:hypothetical protein